MTLQILLRLMALVSLAMVAAGGYLVWSWEDIRRTVAPPGVRLDPQDWRLWVGGALLAWWLLGRLPMMLAIGRSGHGRMWLHRLPAQGVEAEDGARLPVERSGRDAAPVIVLVHGWGLDRRMWNAVRERLETRYQVLTYDLAGLGQSKGPPDGVYDIERQCDHLLAVVGKAGQRQVLLVGHSIGGMIVQTFCRRYPEVVRTRVAGMVLANTTHCDPSQTMILSGLVHAMKPLLMLAMRLEIWLEPLAWLMNWQSYLSGSTHLAMRLGGFGTRPSWEALELVARDATANRPSVQAKGNIAMLSWSVTDDLPRLRAPALVLVGGRDIVTLPRAGETIAAALPDARLKAMPPAGHLGPIELSDNYAEAILGFADEVFTRGAQDAHRRPGAVARDTGPQREPGRRDGEQPTF